MKGQSRVGIARAAEAVLPKLDVAAKRGNVCTILAPTTFLSGSGSSYPFRVRCMLPVYSARPSMICGSVLWLAFSVSGLGLAGANRVQFAVSK